METRPLGRTGTSVSQLALGTIYFGTEIDRETSFAIMDTYYEYGGRFIDTANNYATWIEGYDEPQAEYVIGEWLEERGVREEMVIATKTGFNPPHIGRSLDPDWIQESAAESRQRLGIDTIDLLYSHVDDPATSQREVMAAYANLVEADQVTYLGASNMPAWRIARANQISAAEGWPRYECVQPRFSYLIPDRDAGFGGQLPTSDEVVDYCSQAELTLVPYSPTLSGAYGRDNRPTPEQYVRDENRLKMRLVRELAERKDVDGNALALAWMLSRDHPTVPIIGCSTVDQLETNLRAIEISFSEDELKWLNSIESYGFGGWRVRE